MRTILLLALATTGCYSTIPESRGVTRASYAGTTHLVFTNATPERMCNLSIASATATSYGDNWLPEGGLASGASIELRIKPGTYHTTWSTCREDFKQPFFAGTLYREFAFTLDRQEAQLYAYISDTVAPTKRAAVLGRQFNVVRAIGQKIDPARAHLAAVPSHTERRLIEGTAPTTYDVATTKVDLHDCIDWSLAKSMKKRPAVKATPGAKRADVAVASPSVHRSVRMY
jgi:hypothetical protein